MIPEVSAPAPQSAETNMTAVNLRSPHQTLHYLYLAIVLLFTAALLVNVFVKIRIQHPQVILGGMLVILVAGLFIVLNQHVAAGSILIL